MVVHNLTEVLMSVHKILAGVLIMVLVHKVLIVVLMPMHELLAGK